MRRTVEFIAALALFAALSWLGIAASRLFGLGIPGPVLGLILYMALLWLGKFDWTMVSARWLTSLLGAMIVPPLVGIALFAGETMRGGWRLAVVLIVGPAVTGVATALLFRLVGGKA